MDRDFMGNVIKDINKSKTKYDIEKQYWIEYSEELQERIDKAIEYIERVMTIIKEQPRTDIDDFWILEKLQIFLDILKGEENESN